MKTHRQVLAIVSISVIFGTFVGMVAHYQREAGIQEGKEAKVLELAKVFAPYGYEKIREAKADCEGKTGMVCQIYGGFAPVIKRTAEVQPKQGPI